MPTTTANSKRTALAMIIGCVALALPSTIWIVWRMALPLEIDPNEPWNGWWANAAFTPEGLYPGPQALIANNYPPLSFVLLHGLSRLSGLDPIDCGRLLSITAIAAIVAGLWAVMAGFARLPRLAVLAGTAWLLALLVTHFSRYAGMNDPQLVAIAVMLAGLALALQHQGRMAPLIAGTALMVGAGFIKHSLWAMPLSLLLFLWWTDKRRAAAFTVAGFALAMAGLGLCAAIWGNLFFQQLAMPRHATWSAAFNHLPGLSWFLVAALAFAWSNARSWHDPATRFTGIFLIVALAVDLLQRRGDGVDINAEMELAIASAMAMALSINKLVTSARDVTGSVATALTAFALLPLLISFPLEALNIYSSGWRAKIHARAASFSTEVARIKALDKPIVCAPASLCYRAGKANAFDFFITSQRVKTGTWTQAQLQAKIAEDGIAFEAPRTGFAW